jgi:hypothetical protein
VRSTRTAEAVAELESFVAMNHIVAYELLTAELTAYRDLAYVELCQVVGERTSRTVQGRDGIYYSLAVVTRWRFHPDGDIRVTVFVGEANWGGPHDSIDETIVIARPDCTFA